VRARDYRFSERSLRSASMGNAGRWTSAEDYRCCCWRLSLLLRNSHRSRRRQGWPLRAPVSLHRHLDVSQARTADDRVAGLRHSATITRLRQAQGRADPAINDFVTPQLVGARAAFFDAL